MATINKKTWPHEFEAVMAGKKKADLRLSDFEIAEGDTLVLEEWDPETKRYTGRKIEKKVSNVSKFKLDSLYSWSQAEIAEKGLQIISFE